jgi:EAL domain-containing protein (putative c-di-GMP-specific phosphodiesterase class I)
LASFEPKLQASLRERNVVPHFQPVIGITDMTVVGDEILGRVADGDLPSEPSELLVMAEWLGYDADLSALFREVGVDIGRNLVGSPLLFINTTPSEVYKTNVLLESLKRINDMAPANRIILEVNEKSDEAETCQQLGFNFAQGYFYGRPLPITEITI